MKSPLLLISFLAVATVSLAQDDATDSWAEDEWAEADSAGIQWHGFVEAALGSRWEEDSQTARTQSLGDLRVRAETDWVSDRFSVGFTGELFYDTYLQGLDGELRELTVAFSPRSNWDLKLGRQVLTWGTGDLLFLNDLFPKDWVSFFAGRDDEYLKAPSNAVRSSWYTDVVNVDLAWTPVFTPDNYLTGERFSFFSPLAGQRVAPEPPLHGIKPDKDIENGEFAVRLFKTIAGTEFALYAYDGYFHQPTALTSSFQPTFAPLTSIGASMRRPFGGGLFNAETAYHASRDDRSGDNPLIPNDQIRLLLAYEREAVTHLTVAFQYYLEWTQDHDALIANSLAATFEPDEFRHLLTNRLSYRVDQDKLTLSLFTFYSPSDADFYIRPSLSYRYSDQWSFAGGANIFGGSDEYTFFNQFSDNSNLYVRVRYNY